MNFYSKGTEKNKSRIVGAELSWNSLIKTSPKTTATRLHAQQRKTLSSDTPKLPAHEEPPLSYPLGEL